MNVLVYPADRSACGNLRLIWPAELLRQLGHQVRVVSQQERKVPIDLQGDEVRAVHLPSDVDVVVLQRITHRYLADAVSVMRRQGVTVVIDVDDDLSAIHPDNPAFQVMHPKGLGKPDHSWRNLTRACANASAVTATTPALLDRYKAGGAGFLLPNYLPDHAYVEWRDDGSVLWPASLHSHPNDPAAVGNAMRRLVQDGGVLRCLGKSVGTGRAFALTDDLAGSDPVDIMQWPQRIAEASVGIAPLADTRFNAAKSWLKPLELSAAGVPWVASPRTEYKRLHDMGAGVLAEKPSQWYQAVSGLLEDDVRRKELSEAGREVAESLRLRDHVALWWEAWTRARDADGK